MRAIMYHYVREQDELYPYSSHVGLDEFQETIRRLMSLGYQFANVTELLNEYKCGDKDRLKTVFLTFDDGFSDHYRVAECLLSLGINKATFYIPTYPLTQGRLLSVHKAHVIRSRYGPKCLEFLTRACDELGIDPTCHTKYEMEKKRHSSAYSRQEDDCRTKEFKRLINYVGAIGMREAILDQILSYEDLNYCASDFYLSKPQIREMAEVGFEIGSHGVSHTLLSRLSRKEQFKELMTSKQILENISQCKVNSFCYPYGGQRSYNRQTLSELKRSGYTSAMSVDYRDITLDDITNQPFELPRYDCNQIDILFDM
jgi:peptidoglycan/xylan/chitin deacetylase (PgdA/CDA1 family)